MWRWVAVCDGPLLAATLDEDEDDGLGEHAGAWCAGPGRAVVVTMAL